MQIKIASLGEVRYPDTEKQNPQHDLITTRSIWMDARAGLLIQL